MDKGQINQFLNMDCNFINKILSLNNLELRYGCVDGRIIGTGRSDYTQDSEVYDFSIYNKPFSLIDIPGIEGDESKFEKIIESSLEKSHTIFYVNGSNKKIERSTLEKIKKYMHDGTSVYAVFNVHCKAKKKRVEGIDKTFSQELSEAYIHQQEIVNQTKNELVSFLGNNFKGSIMVNGLLSFCSLAYDSKGKTTIIYDKDKNLRTDQKKYSNEYNDNVELMLEDSHINEIKQIIDDKVYNFEKTIYDENIKKLKNRISEITEKISLLDELESKKLTGFNNAYDEYLVACEDAKDSFIDELYSVGRKSSNEVIGKVQEEILKEIDKQNKNRKSLKEIENYVNQYFRDENENITKRIQKNITDNIEIATKDYSKSLSDAAENLQKDINREQLKFNINIDEVHIDISDELRNSLKFTFKDFGSIFVEVCASAYGGFTLGSLIPIPIIGNVIGTIVGAIFGIVNSIWKIFNSRANKINKIKTNVMDSLDELSYNISESVKKNIINSEIIKFIEDEYSNICNVITKREQALDDVQRLLKTTLSELKYKRRTIL